MNTIRIGNDITIRATVTRRGADEDFTGKTLTLLRTSLSTVRLTPIVSGNQLTALWSGTEHEKTGKYTVTLVEDYGTGQRNTVDAPAEYLSCGAAWPPLPPCVGWERREDDNGRNAVTPYGGRWFRMPSE